MLKGISPLISPTLLKVLHEMGHGDEMVFADAHFPGHSIHHHVIRADGLHVADLLAAVLPLFELDSYVDHPVMMMAAVEGDTLDPSVERAYIQSIQKTNPEITAVERIDRFAFYKRAEAAYVVVMTGETAKYGNVILKKGVTGDK